MTDGGARSLDDLVVDTLKTLAMDAIEKANSGHPGMPMGMADAASVLWRQFLTVDPTAPRFCDRDRFVLSGGHGSMLLYGLLHLAGFDLPMAEIKEFRQLHSKTPGHPEVALTPGVEMTTGPLGQGFASAVGMAMAERFLAARFNRPGLPVVDHLTWVLCGDGDLHEGISHEAASLAGHLALGKLIVLFDDNGITIDGATALSTSRQDATRRFQGHGWQVLEIDGHDRAAVAEALAAARDERARPTLIRCHTHIGHSSPHKQDSEKAHGSPLGAAEISLTKAVLGWPLDAQFLVPAGVPAAFAGLRERGAAKRARWERDFARYRTEHPDLAAEWERLHGDGDGLPAGLEALLPTFADDRPEATRVSSGKVINALAAALPTLWGGSADLAGSTKTDVAGGGITSAEEPGGRNIRWGIREHGMAAALNGMALHGGIFPYGGTFLTFSDYLRPALRLAALMEQRVIHVLTHDSIFLGEDGPTHQSVEHAMALRMIPNCHVFRPADGRETAAAWLVALRRSDGPSALLLTRQDLPQITDAAAALAGVDRGAYVVRDGPAAVPDVILIGTGSELHLCVQTAEALARDVDWSIRVVSMPCAERFLAQPPPYRERVLPPACKVRVAVEAGRTFGWERFVGDYGAAVGIDHFGESAPAEVLAEQYGFTVHNVVNQVKLIMADARKRAARDLEALRSLAG